MRPDLAYLQEPLYQVGKNRSRNFAIPDPASQSDPVNCLCATQSSIFAGSDQTQHSDRVSQDDEIGL